MLFGFDIGLRFEEIDLENKDWLDAKSARNYRMYLGFLVLGVF